MMVSIFSWLSGIYTDEQMSTHNFCPHLNKAICIFIIKFKKSADNFGISLSWFGSQTSSKGPMIRAY